MTDDDSTTTRDHERDDEVVSSRASAQDRLAKVQKFYVSQNIVPKETAIAELFTNQFVQ